MKNVPVILILALAGAWLSCRETDSIFPNNPPIAVAGDNRSVVTGEIVHLDGSASSDQDGDPLFFAWRLLATPNGSTIALDNFDSVTTSFVSDRAGVYRLELVVSDNIVTSSDTVEITSVTSNGSPIITAGQDGLADLGVSYSLKGAASDPEGSPLTIAWTLQTKPSGSSATIQNVSSLNASFVPDRHGTYVARLQASDGSFTVEDEVTITTSAAAITSIAPTSGTRGTTVKINGKNFSTTAIENLVTFNGKPAIVSASSYTTIDAIVPTGAGTGVVAVNVNNGTATGPVFTYLPIAIAGEATKFTSPFHVVADAAGNLYITDYVSHQVRKLTPSGTLTTLAGTGQAGYSDGKVENASFNKPAGIAIDAAGENLYVADNGNHCIRVISLTSSTVSTYAGFPQPGYLDGKGSNAQFNSPLGIAMDAAGNLFVADNGNNRVRKISPSVVVTTLAPNGPSLNGLGDVALDAANNLYVAETLSHRIRKITPQEVVSTLAGNTTAGFINATGTAARFNLPYSVACDANGNVYVADFGNHTIRRITPAGATTTVIGTGVAGYLEGSNAQFNSPTGIHVMPNGNIYLADFSNQRIRLITFE